MAAPFYQVLAAAGYCEHRGFSTAVNYSCLGAGPYDVQRAVDGKVFGIGRGKQA